MNIREMIEVLEDIAQVHGNVEVRLMTQENWPFENSIRHIKTSDEVSDGDEDELADVQQELADLEQNSDGLTSEDQVLYDELRERYDELLHQQDEKLVIAYLVEGSQLCYGNKAYFER